VGVAVRPPTRSARAVNAAGGRMCARWGVAVGDDVGRATAVGDKDDDEDVEVGRVVRDGPCRTSAAPTMPARRTTSGTSMAHRGKRRKDESRDAPAAPGTGATRVS